MPKVTIDVNAQMTSSIFILKDGKAIIRIESLTCEGADTVIEQIKTALDIHT